MVQVLAGRQEAQAGVQVTERATVPQVIPEPPGWARPYVDEDGTVRIPAGHEEHDDDELYGDVLETYVDDHQGDIDWLDAPE